VRTRRDRSSLRAAAAFRAALACASTLGVTAPAAADLGTDVERVKLAWSAFGRVHHLTPRFLERGDRLPLLLPAELLDPETPGCVTVALLTPTSLHFVLDSQPAEAPPAERAPDESLAGALEIARCGADKAAFSSLGVVMRSPQGLLETLVVATPDAAPPLTTVLPHRDPGPIAPLSGSGPRPSMAPLSARARAIEQRAAREGALEFSSEDVQASGAGAGSELFAFGAGCHVLELLADEATSPGLRGADVDIEVSEADGGEILAVDQGESSDARVVFCLGEARALRVRFQGGAPMSRLLMVRTRFELSAELPAPWDSDTRARFSAVIRATHQELRGAKLVDAALGVQGATHMPQRLEPGSCYLALVVPLRGDGAMLSVQAEAGPRSASSRSLPGAPGTGVGFCTDHDTRAVIEVEARGFGVVWMSALFRTASVPLRGEALLD
jgi:hypothetical protein